MKEPMHKFKWLVRYADNYKPARWSYDGRPCWLGSGITDKNGREIFEGDQVQLRDGKTYTVTFDDGGFWIGDAPLVLFKGDCEVIGHVND